MIRILILTGWLFAVGLTSPVKAQGDAAIAQSILPKLSQLASEGDAEASYHLGMLYHIGLGVPRDYEKAFSLFQQASDGGDKLADYKLGCYYAGQGGGVVALDAAQAFSFKKKAADAGYSFAQYDVAMRFLQSGKINETLVWLRRSADQGYQPAFLGLIAVYGEDGVLERNRAEELDALLKYFKLGIDYVLDAAEIPEDLKEGLSQEDVEAAIKQANAWTPEKTLITAKAVSGLHAALSYAEAQ